MCSIFMEDTGYSVIVLFDHRVLIIAFVEVKEVALIFLFLNMISLFGQFQDMISPSF